MNQLFADRFALIRYRYKLKYKTLMEVLGVTKDTARNYLSGRTQMSDEEIVTLATHLRIDSDWLLRGGVLNPIEDSTINEPTAVYSKDKTSIRSSLGSEHTLKDKYGGMATEVFGVIFDELKSLQERVSALEKQINDSNTR